MITIIMIIRCRQTVCVKEEEDSLAFKIALIAGYND